jgi:hypothetical protein
MLIDTSDTPEVEVIVSDSGQCLRIQTGEFSEFISINKYYTVSYTHTSKRPAFSL